jgi:hypothetical protein
MNRSFRKPFVTDNLVFATWQSKHHCVRLFICQYSLLRLETAAKGKKGIWSVKQQQHCLSGVFREDRKTLKLAHIMSSIIFTLSGPDPG